MAKKIFVIQPLGPNYDSYNMVRQAASDAGLEVFRMEDLLGAMPTSVWATTLRGIENCDGVVCDVSEPASSNIMYEVGFATALEKPVILIANNFDPILPLVGMRILRYASGLNGNDTAFIHYLSEELRSAMDSAAAVGTPDEDDAPGSVFVSYSHKDQGYLDRLMIHLSPLEKQGRIKLWADTKLRDGDRWKEEIERTLNESKIAVLLISADFLASEFIIDNELPPLLRAAQTKGTQILPVIVKACRFVREPTLACFHAVNDPQRPLANTDEAERERVYDKIAEAVEASLGV